MTPAHLQRWEAPPPPLATEAQLLWRLVDRLAAATPSDPAEMALLVAVAQAMRATTVPADAP